MKIAKNSKLLMIGDSITDCGRAQPVAEGLFDPLGRGFADDGADHGAVVGGIAVLVLLVVAYNSSDLRFGDQVVGTLVVVVLPEVLAASLAACAAMLLARLVAALPRPH